MPAETDRVLLLLLFACSTEPSDTGREPVDTAVVDTEVVDTGWTWARRELIRQRTEVQPGLEAAALIDQLMYEPQADAIPLAEYGLGHSDVQALIQEKLPSALADSAEGLPADAYYGQAALAYLLLATGSTCAVTLCDQGTDDFLAFDQSHASHRDAQRAHWLRALDVSRQLIELLQATEYEDGTGPTGTSLWDRSMIVFATEFGRDKFDKGDADSVGTGHHLNNALMVCSPLVQGNRALGEVDPRNGWVTGFDPETGEATPYTELDGGGDPYFDDPNLPPSEETVVASLLGALGVQCEGAGGLPALTG